MSIRLVIQFDFFSIPICKGDRDEYAKFYLKDAILWTFSIISFRKIGKIIKKHVKVITFYNSLIYKYGDI